MDKTHWHGKICSENFNFFIIKIWSIFLDAQIKIFFEKFSLSQIGIAKENDLKPIGA